MGRQVGNVNRHASGFRLSNVGETLDDPIGEIADVQPRTEFVENGQMLAADPIELAVYDCCKPSRNSYHLES